MDTLAAAPIGHLLIKIPNPIMYAKHIEIEVIHDV